MSVGWDVEWGSWVLGDLADALGRTADLLGRQQEVSRIEVVPPTDSDKLPLVTVHVGDEMAKRKLRKRLIYGEHEVEFISQSPTGWTAETAGLVLTVVAVKSQ
ncbi:hypothetical protein SAMN04488570_0278 [Nocardioides scoriae]|uniref:Uncharacterized protein n=1 Tax=Nocardioides scoriae TaxID=642780 RepID=A0A1H1LM34_9ACTN|nr:hypothetical protein [Nocardioides scoriae]SDR75581.1 hypothetical protein SAMN04488570_0278 [Nocardioides scoriae]